MIYNANNDFLDYFISFAIGGQSNKAHHIVLTLTSCSRHCKEAKLTRQSSVSLTTAPQ